MNLEILKEKWDLLPNSVKQETTRRGFDAMEHLCEIVEDNKYVNILEIGTFLGRTTCHLGATCAPLNGKVTTININESEYKYANNLASELGLDNIDFRLGSSLDVIPQLDGDWDFVFIDGHHSYRFAMAEFNLVKDRMKGNAMIIFDDAGGIHCDAKGDGGVPRAVKESGATLTKLGDVVVGIIKIEGKSNEST
jgi:predicted O-methyltransferase YrrM